jgi:hypothetical protein
LPGRDWSFVPSKHESDPKRGWRGAVPASTTLSPDGNTPDELETLIDPAG